MKLSNTELSLIKRIGEGIKNIGDMSEELGISKSQTYRTLNSLTEKGILSSARKGLSLQDKTHVNLLVRTLLLHPNAVDLLSDSGINILKDIIDPKRAKDIVRDSNLGKDTVYNKLREFQNVSISKKKGHEYYFNPSLWHDLRGFIIEVKRYEENIDERVGAGSTIYHKTDDEIVFSTREKQDASYTAFSAYKDHGIRILTLENYYYLPKKRLSTRDIMQHSLYVAEKERDIRNLIYLTLFYLRYKSRLKDIKHPVLDGLKKVLRGETIDDFPTLAEIRDRAEVYGIKV